MIEKVPCNLIARQSSISGFLLASAVDSICPYCKKLVSFTLQDWSGANQLLMFSKSRCPRCAEYPLFITVNFQRTESSDLAGETYIYPDPKVRMPVSGLDNQEKFTPQLQRAYQAALNVYNASEWVATAVLLRRLLEGITLTLLPDQTTKQGLYQQLKEIPNHVNLQEPILTLADTIRKGGNLGAHFDLEKEPSEDMARMMLELLEYLIEYLFILPEKIKYLHDTIEELKD